jgi:hypothetical protein
LADKGGHVMGLQYRIAAFRKTDKLFHNVIESSDLIPNDTGQTIQVIFLKSLARHADRIEGIADLVGDTRGQAAHGREPLGTAETPFHLSYVGHMSCLISVKKPHGQDCDENHAPCQDKPSLFFLFDNLIRGFP